LTVGDADETREYVFGKHRRGRKEQLAPKLGRKCTPRILWRQEA